MVPTPESDRIVATGADALKSFLAARDFLLAHREDYETAYRGFGGHSSKPSTGRSTISMSTLGGNAKPALWIFDDDAALN